MDDNAPARQITEGWTALAAGRWQAARTAFEAALCRRESAEALEGLAAAAWWLDDGPATTAARSGAYRLYRDADDRYGAARVAAGLALDYYLFHGDRAVANGYLARARSVLQGSAPSSELAFVLGIEAQMALFADKNPVRAERLGRRAEDAARIAGDTDLELLAQVHRGVALVEQKHVAEGMRLIDDTGAAVLAGDFRDPQAMSVACCCLLQACESVRDFDRAEQWCRQLESLSKRWANGMMFATCRVRYARVLTWHGRWEEADALLGAAIDGLFATKPAEAAFGLADLARLRCRQGRHEEAEYLLQRLDVPPVRMLARPIAHLAAAELALARSEAASAVDYAVAFLRALPQGQHTGRTEGLELLVRACLAAGELPRAHEAVGELERIARAIDTSPLWASAAFCAGELAAARGEHASAAERLIEAVDLYEGSGAPFEAARARVVLGRSLHALGHARRAAEVLARARDDFVRLGARDHVRHAGACAAAVRAPASNCTPLTARELEVLQGVAQGLSNERIAARLHVSVRTVERHLSNIYLKINVFGRSARSAAVTWAVSRQLV